MAAETVACLVLLFDFLVLALKSDELTCCATVKLNEQTTQCSKKEQQKTKRGQEAEPEVAAAAAAAETTGGATEAGMEVKAGTVQRQTETVALGHTATGLSSLSLSLCRALFPLVSPSISIPLSPSLVDPFSLPVSACCTCSRSGSLVYTSHHGLGSFRVRVRLGELRLLRLGSVRLGLV